MHDISGKQSLAGVTDNVQQSIRRPSQDQYQVDIRDNPAQDAQLFAVDINDEDVKAVLTHILTKQYKRTPAVESGRHACILSCHKREFDTHCSPCELQHATVAKS